MIQILNSEKDNLISAKLSGKISKQDVKIVHSKIHDVLEKNEKVNFYFEMENLEGYTTKGFLEDIKTDNAHFSDYGKMAFVGENKWQEWVIKITDFFTSSEVKYFGLKNKQEAVIWINK